MTQPNIRASAVLRRLLADGIEKMNHPEGTRMKNPVEALLIRMMQAFPVLYPTRADGLKHLFTEWHTHWTDDGQLVFTDEDAQLTRDDSSFRDEEKEVKTHYAGEAKTRLRARRFNAKISFTIENAPLLAQELESELSFPPPAAYPRFDDMPADVAPEWLDAAKDLATIVFHYTARPCSQGHHVQQHEQQQVQQAKARCAAFLKRFEPDGADQTREARLSALRIEAQALGIKIVE